MKTPLLLHKLLVGVKGIVLLAVVYALAFALLAALSALSYYSYDAFTKSAATQEQEVNENGTPETCDYAWSPWTACSGNCTPPKVPAGNFSSYRIGTTRGKLNGHEKEWPCEFDRVLWVYCNQHAPNCTTQSSR